MSKDNLNEFQRGYVEAALWTETFKRDSDESYMDENFDIEDIEQGTIEQMVKDCNAFYEQNARDIIWACDNASFTYDRGNAGHDFWLTRNGHGTGYWSRELGQVGLRLTENAKSFGQVHLELGDNGRIYGTR